MQTNFYFLRKLTKALELRIGGSVISECFSQTRDELIIRFEVGRESFYIKASLAPSLSCLSFPARLERARKNSVDLFQQIVGRRVTGLRQFDNERSFAILLSEDNTLLFKMHGNRTNIIHFVNDEPADLFRKNITTDLSIRPGALDRAIDWSREYFMKNIGNFRAAYFTFGRVVWRYLEERRFGMLAPAEQWGEFQAVLQLLTEPTYYITFINAKPALSLLPTGEVRKVLKDPIEAANEFFYYATQDSNFLREKTSMIAQLRARLESGENYCKKNSQRLDELRNDNHYKVWADILMANLQSVDARAETVVLENFYDNQRPVEIKLRKDLTPQKTAEVYYRKAKNQHIEIDRLEQSIRQKHEEMSKVRRQLAEAEAATELKMLRELEAVTDPRAAQKKREPLPYHEFLFRDFRVLVGKNAQSNDLLTFKFGYKDDLWLHAKDVTGSHVLIKYQSGKNFPNDVIEYAASLAAFNSKRRNDSICPVVVTPKKFVRKRKGDPPGAVVVEREQVVMVEPAKM